MNMTHTSRTDALRYGTPLLILMLNILLTTGLIVVLKLQAFGWLMALFLGSFGGAILTLVAVFTLVTVLIASDKQTYRVEDTLY